MEREGEGLKVSKFNLPINWRLCCALFIHVFLLLVVILIINRGRLERRMRSTHMRSQRIVSQLLSLSNHKAKTTSIIIVFVIIIVTSKALIHCDGHN